MKLGEALALRADLQKRMNRVQALLRENATVQEGAVPVVSATAPLEEYRQLSAEHEGARADHQPHQHRSTAHAG